LLDSNSRLMPCIVGGVLVAALGWVLIHSIPLLRKVPLLGLIFGIMLMAASAAIAVAAPSRRSAWRRLIIIAAVLSFALATALFAWPPLAASPDSIQGARGENAPGFALFILIGVVIWAFLAAPVFAALGVLLSLLAWILGREPTMRRIDW